MTFKSRALVGGETLGERFRELRLERRLSTEDVAAAIGVTKKYIEAIEEAQYAVLPGPVYAKNFVRKYAQLLRVPEITAVERFEEEYRVVYGKKGRAPHMVQRARTDFPWYIRYSRFIIGGAVLVAIGSYLIAEVVNLTRPPELVVVSPAADISVATTTILVSGKTDPEATVKINNQQAETQPDGSFSEEVALQIGLNALKVTAARKYGQVAQIVRQVYLRPSSQPE